LRKADKKIYKLVHKRKSMFLLMEFQNNGM